MKEIYYLNAKELPTIPVPHDCIIKEITVEDDSLVFIFEDDISYHDSIKNTRPDAKSLIIRFHFLNDINDIQTFMRKKPDRLLNKTGVYKEIDLINQRNILIENSGKKLEYLYHNVGYCSIIVKLCSLNSVILDMDIDYVEFEWINQLKGCDCCNE